MADFRHHSSAVDLLLDDFRAPDAAADRAARTLNRSGAGTAWIAGIRNTLFANRSRNVPSYGLPLPAADVDAASFRDGLADSVADVLPAGLCFRLPGGVTLVTVAGLVAGLADVVAHGAVTRLVAGFADGVTHVSMTRLVTRLANVAGDGAIARFLHRPANPLLHTPIFGLVHRLADGVALVAVARLIHVADALDRNALGALIVHCLHTGVLLLFHDNLSHRPILRRATLCSSKVTAVVTGLGRAVRKTASSAQPGHHQTAVQQHGNCSSGSNHEPSHRLTPHYQVTDRMGEIPANISSST